MEISKFGSLILLRRNKKFEDKVSSWTMFF